MFANENVAMRLLLLLQWLRGCGEPVIPHHLYDKFLALPAQDPEQMVTAFDDIPPERRGILFYVLDIIAADDSQAAACQLWAPCLLTRAVETPAQIVRDASAAAAVTHLMALHRRHLRPPAHSASQILCKREAEPLKAAVSRELAQVGSTVSQGVLEALLAEQEEVESSSYRLPLSPLQDEAEETKPRLLYPFLQSLLSSGEFAGDRAVQVCVAQHAAVADALRCLLGCGDSVETPNRASKSTRVSAHTLPAESAARADALSPRTLRSRAAAVPGLLHELSVPGWGLLRADAY